MSKSSNDGLFRLIHSMTKNEKIYFKKFAQRHVIGEKNSYVKLFDALNNQKTYVETNLLRKFKNESFIIHLSATKNYLFNLILRSLEQFDSSNQMEDKLQTQIRHIHILFQKGLIKEAQKLLRSSKKMAYDYEATNELLQLLDLDRGMLAAYEEKDLEKRLFALFEEEEKVMVSAYRTRQLMHCQYKVNLKMNIKGKPFEEQLNEIAEIMNAEVLQHEPSEFATVRERHFYHEINSRFAFLQRDFNKTAEHLEQIIEGFRSKPKMLELSKHLENYIRMLNNLVLMYSRLENHEGCERALEAIQKSPKGERFIEALKFYLYYNSTLVYLLSKIDYKGASSLIDEVLVGLEKHEKHLELVARLVIRANLVFISFIAGRYDLTIESSLNIQNLDKAGRRQDILHFAMIMNCLAHFEEENYEFLLYQISNFENKFKKRENTGYELLVMKMLRQLINSASMNERKLVLKEYRQPLIDTPNHFADYKSKENFSFVDWIDSKISGRSYSEIVKNRA